MATLNKVMLIGRFTRDPEPRTFSSGGRLVKFGLAVNNRKKTANGWEDDPVFVDVVLFGKSDSKVLDIVSGQMGKGDQIFVEGRLQLEQWDDKQTGQRRQKISVVAENVQFLEPKKDGGQGQGYPQGNSQYQQQGRGGYQSEGQRMMNGATPANRNEEEIPF